MSLFTAEQRKVAEAISYLAYCNPFLPERIEYEQIALGEGFIGAASDWNTHVESEGNHPNIIKAYEMSEGMAEAIRLQLLENADQDDDEITLYEDVTLFMLYHRYRQDFNALIEEMVKSKKPQRPVEFYDQYEPDFKRFFEVPGVKRKSWFHPEHGFAIYFQVRRAFYHIFTSIIGRSKPTMLLRAAAWQSIFTHSMPRYSKTLYGRMGDITTLITGPSGTGKELVARAIGYARYIPFDPKAKRFTEDFQGTFFPVNLSAMSPALIESELFGHKKGAFTGATSDREGWLEQCPALGTIFLDEIGELDLSIQVKLLRVLQERKFQRVGEVTEREFRGKVIAATNENLDRLMQIGKFRRDLFYRLCSDTIRVPSLRDRIADCPEELESLVNFLSRQIMGEDYEELAIEVLKWIKDKLGDGYPWHGNVRELEQCIRNILVRQEYYPASSEDGESKPTMPEFFEEAGLTAEQLLSYYCTLVYVRSGENTEEAARRLNLDRRTVQAKLDPNVLERLRST